MIVPRPSAARANRSTTETAAPSFLDPQALMRIKSLELRARAVVDGFLAGFHRSPQHGFSVEFTEYRQYSPGDDLRYLDWRLYARSDRYYVKRFEDETNLRCYLLLDLSRSMSFASLPYSKADYARTAAATLAYFLALQRDAVGLVTFDRDIQQYLPARYRAGHLHQLLLCLDQSSQGTQMAAPLDHVARLARKRGLIVVISDLLTPVEELEHNLSLLRTRGHDVLVLRVVDPAERDFSFTEPSLFVDAETGRELYVDPAAVRAQYQQRWLAHAARLQGACADLGIDYFEVASAEPLELVLYRLLQARQRRGRATGRRGPTRR